VPRSLYQLRAIDVFIRPQPLNALPDLFHWSVRLCLATGLASRPTPRAGLATARSDPPSERALIAERSFRRHSEITTLFSAPVHADAYTTLSY
jgi:hypothetical protein